MRRRRILVFVLAGRLIRGRSGKLRPGSVTHTVMAKKYLRLIVNGKVVGCEALRAAVVRQRGLGHRVEVHVTWEGGDARRFGSQPGEADAVVAVGGDGTVNEVLHGLMTLPTDARPALAVIPLGTANDFARGCGIPAIPARHWRSASPAIPSPWMWAGLTIDGSLMQRAVALVLRLLPPHRRNSNGCSAVPLTRSWPQSLQRTSVPTKDASFCRIRRSPVRM